MKYENNVILKTWKYLIVALTRINATIFEIYSI